MLESTSAATSTYTQAQLVAWRNGIFAAFAVGGLGLASWMARTPAVKDALEATTAQMGVLILGPAIGSIIGLTLSSHLISRFGTRNVLLWCLIVSPLGIVFAGVTVTVFANFWLATAGLFIFGLAFGTCDVTMNLSGAINERHLGRTVMPLFHAFFSIGTILGAGAGAASELLHVSLATQSLVVGAIMLVVGIIGALATQSEVETPAALSSDSPPVESGWRSRMSLWQDKRTLLIGVIALGTAFGEGSAEDWLPLASVEGHGVDNPTGAIVFVIFVTAMTVGRLSGPWVLDRFGRVAVLRTYAALAVVGVLVFILVPVLWIALCGVVLWGLGSALGFPTAMSAAADDPRSAAARVSIVATIGYLAFLVGPPVIGFLGEHVGLLRALLLVVVLITFAGLASGAARERSRA